MNQAQQPDALRLADDADRAPSMFGRAAAVEIRRLHASLETERQKRQEAELMAECMDMVRQELIEAGIIDKSVPPMMLPEAIVRAIRAAVSAEREACVSTLEDMKRKSRNSLFRSALTCAAGNIRARGKP